MPRVALHLDLPADRLLHLYAGRAHEVVARAHDGRRVRFPASVLRPFVTRDGVHGEFVLVFTDDHRVLRLERAHPG